MLSDTGGGSFPPPQRLPGLSQVERDGGCTLTATPIESEAGGLIVVRCPPGAPYNGGISTTEHVSSYCAPGARPATRFRYDKSGSPIGCKR